MRDEEFKAGKFNTSYLDSKMEKFNLGGVSLLADEEKKISFLSNIIKKIKENNIITR